MSSALTKTPEREFNNKEDRCDRCGAPAVTYVEKEFLALFFCGHHFAKVEAKLTEEKWLIVRRKEEEDEE